MPRPKGGQGEGRGKDNCQDSQGGQVKVKIIAKWFKVKDKIKIRIEVIRVVKIKVIAKGVKVKDTFKIIAKVSRVIRLRVIANEVNVKDKVKVVKLRSLPNC